ncbi:MAG: hypothetical protein U0X91_23610 [Spirosomataceae bacterium]
MKKHPVDDLFSRKLRDAEITPRAEVYQKLQQRLQSKQKRLGWWQQGPWLAAAGVSLLLTASWVIWKSTASDDAAVAQLAASQSHKLSQKPAPGKETVKVKPELPNQQVSPRSIPEQVASVETEKLTPKNGQSESSESSQKTKPQQISTAPIAQVAEIPQKAPQSVSVMPADEPKAVAQIQTPSADSRPSTKTVVLQLPELPETLVAVNEKPTSNTLPESTAPKPDENILNEPRKSTRMAKVWRQLKNAKNGEKVDWEEVGFNPNKLLAKATRKEL